MVSFANSNSVNQVNREEEFQRAQQRERQRQLSRLSVASTQQPPSYTLPTRIDRASLDQQQAALNLAYFTSQAGASQDQTQILIDALIAEADPSVIEMIAKGDMHDVIDDQGKKIGRMNLQALKAMQAIVGKLVAKAEGRGVEATGVVESNARAEDSEMADVEESEEEAKKRKRAESKAGEDTAGEPARKKSKTPEK